METTFKNTHGNIGAGKFFAVFLNKNGTNFKKSLSNPQIDFEDFSLYPNVVKIQLYKNGTENLAPIMIDELVNY